ncbi:MAG: NAD(P)-dependent alcohol dehydrogenase [Arenicella sp.]|nr:NAD(P)-dependent alcohol dehydrogenase [Arenicella sp.]
MGLFTKILGVVGIIIGLLVLALIVTIGYTSDCGERPAAEDSANSMQAITYRCYGGPEVLELTDVTKPDIDEDEVLVKVQAAGVNPMDWHYMRGSPYIMRLMSGIGAPSDPRIGSDYAGTIEAVGAAVTGFKPGDRVFGPANGAFAEYVTVQATRSITHMPANTTFEQAAAVPIAAITALQALRDSGQLQAGQSVLINGASGGVGTFAVQIAKSMGAEVTGVCSTRNVDMVKSLGADYVVNYKKEDFVESGKQYDLIIDNVGNWSIPKLRKALKPEGTLVMVGGPSSDWVGPFKNGLVAMITRPFVDQQLKGFLAKFNQPDMATLAQLMGDGKIKSVIDRRYGLSEVPEAIRYSESGRARGKIVINM